VVVHTWTDALARKDVNSQPPLVKVLDVNLATRKRCQKINLGVVEEIVVFPLEARVGFLFNLEHNISRLNTWKLVSLASELDLVAGLDTAIDVNVEDFALDDGFLAVALLAPIAVADDLAFTLAVGTDCLESLDHRTHLAHHVLHAASFASNAFLDRAFLATSALALGADDGLL